MLRHITRVKVPHSKGGASTTRERSTQDQTKHKANHKSARGVTTKWEDNPSTHKTKGVTTRW